MEYTVTGNTYPVKDALKQLGARWDRTNKHWIIPDTAVDAAKKLRVPVGGREELWEPCSECGVEPVDSSGLCRRCRGTEPLRIEPLLSPEDEARQLLSDSGFAVAIYKSASRGPEIPIPTEYRVVAHGSPFGGGYDVDIVTDGEKLYAIYNHHYDGDRDRCYVVDPSNYKPSYAAAVAILITAEGLK